MNTDFNLTQICVLPKEQAVTQVAGFVTLPSLIIFLLGIAAIYLVIGLFSVKGSESKKKILGITLLSTLVGAFLLVGIYLNPNVMLGLFEKFLKIFIN